MEAVDRVFEEEKKLVQVEEAEGGKDLSTFSQKLLQIALENRLRMFHFVSEDLMFLNCTVLAPS